MNVQLIGKTKATIVDVDVQCLKKGQTDTTPAAAITVMAKLPNTYLNTIDKTGKLREFWYEKNGQGAKEQKQIDGVEVITDLPQLTQNGVKLGGGFKWAYAQTGCKLIIYRGVRDENAIRLVDGTVRKVSVKCLDGGTIHLELVVFVANLDEETMGAIAVLKKQTQDIELTSPEPAKQQEIQDDDEHLGDTPEQALERADAAAKGGNVTSLKKK